MNDPTVAPDLTTPRAGSGEMFDKIADRYDLLNRIISLGIDGRWRQLTVEALALPQRGRVLDHATGTADLAISIAKHYPEAEVIGVDPSVGMLAIGREKIARLDLSTRVSLMEGSAETLPFDDQSFDGVSMAFGIRNVERRDLALLEMARVLKPSGRVAILELSEPQNGIMAGFARFHVHTVVPWVGSLLSGKSEYRYLQRSIAAFPPPNDFAALMESAGLEVVEIQALTFGVCHLYVARKRAR
jgi:demethylmenaquinone methyltransferase/2-methoxy-6-polyprenyl-1,4-benzoquinol methylase